MKYKYLIFNKKVLIVILFGLFCVPNSSFASSIFASSEDSISAGDTSIINIYIDTEGENINTLDGSIVLLDDNNGNFEIKDISLVNSIFSLWPRKPSLEGENKIYFIGGVPGGINGNHLLLFRVIIKINKSGDFSIKPNKIVAYLNDGLGTSRDITKDISTISIGSPKENPDDKWQMIISNDNIAPEPFEIILNQDTNLFDGKKFISFETIDNESGVSYYEVKEGVYPAVRTGTDYVLIDQEKKIDVTVTAYDRAGNFQVAILKEKESINWLSIIIAVLLIVIVYKIIKKIRRNKRKNV